MAEPKKFPWVDLLNEQALLSGYDTLRRQGLIHELLKEDISSELHFSKDRIILRQGDIGKNVFIIGFGSVRVVLLGDKGEEVVSLYTLRKGDTFGEMALFDDKYRSATVIANSDCTVLSLSGDRLLDVLKDYPEFEVKLLMRLSERLRHTDKQVLSVQTKNIDEKLQHFNTKLNAEIKVIEASLKASQTVFEQTKMRTDEVISSAERSRTRLTFAASIIGFIITLFGLFGFKEFLNVRALSSTVKERLTQIEESSQEIDKMNEEIKSTAAAVSKIQEELAIKSRKLDASIEHTREFIADRVVIPEFKEAIEEDDLGAAFYDYDFIKNLGLSMESYQKKQNLLLVILWVNMLDRLGNRNLPDDKQAREGSSSRAFEQLLDSFVEDAASPKVAYTAHFLLSTYGAATDSERFETHYKRFEKFMETYKGERLAQMDLADTERIFEERSNYQKKRFRRIQILATE